MLADARRRSFDIIAVCKLDRYFRNLRLLLNYLYELEQLGIKFISTHEGLDTSTPYGKFAVQIMGVIAEFERGRIGERVKDSRRYLMSQGRWPGGRPAYGYRWLSKEQKWQVDEKEAEIVKYIYQLYTREGLGMMKIILRLNQEGRRTRLGYAWQFHAIYKILTHSAYKGLHPKGLTMPSIIDPDTWETTQTVRLKVRNVHRNPRNWILQGLCVCGECGRVLSCQQKKNSTQRRHYACRGREKHAHLDGGLRCTLPRVNADVLEKMVWQRLKAVMTDHEALRASLINTLDDLKRRKTGLSQGWADNEKDLRAVNEKKERLGLVYADLAITKEKYEKEMISLKKQESALLKVRTNLDPQAKMELNDIEGAVASLERAIQGKAGKLFLTELGVWVDNIPDGWIVGHGIPGVDSWDDPNALINTETFQVGEHGPLMQMVDGPGQSNFEVPRETVWQNIRSVFERLGIKVYVFRDRVEIRGFIPTEIVDIPDVGTAKNRRSIIPSTKGDREGFHKNPP